MVNNLKIDRPLPPLSATVRVKPVDHRQSNNQQNLSRNNLEERRKKKKSKEDPTNVKISGSGALAGSTQHTRHAAKNKNSRESSYKRIIDVRV